MKPLGSLIAATLMTLTLSGAAAADPVFTAVTGSQFNIQFGTPGLFFDYRSGPMTTYNPWILRTPNAPVYGIYKPYVYKQFRGPVYVPRVYRSPVPGTIIQPGHVHQRGKSWKHRGYSSPGHRHQQRWNHRH